MLKNDYRRAFIMLRPSLSGYGGHARLERRTLTGSLYFIVTAPEGAGELSAALVGQQGGQYYAAPLGAFARDRRGQLTLAWTFDPRDINGRPLEAYAWVAVADTGGGCAVALTGNVNGSREVDPAALEEAVCRLFAAERPPAADLPDPDETADGDVKIYRSIRARAAEAVPVNAEVAPPEPEPESLPEPEPVLAEYAETVEATEAEAVEGPCEAIGLPRTAAQRLGLDITAPWPVPAEPLRRLFATQAPVETPLGDGFVYVATALPEHGGDCLVGLKSTDGRIAGIRYALPGTYAPEPPAGLDDYLWNDCGYWVLDIGVS